MNMEKIEQGFLLMIENIESIAREQNTDFYDAFVEQNAAFLQAKLDKPTDVALSVLTASNQKLSQLHLTKKEWQKLFQFVLLKGAQVAPMQPNHAFTPDSIGALFHFIIETLHPKKDIRVLEMGSGLGNLAEFLLVNTTKNIEYVGFEVDDLLLDLAASMSEIIGSQATFMQVDGVQSQLLAPVDVVISDLPIGFYPDDALAQTFLVGQKQGHTFAHHLMIEQAMKYLKESGFAVFLAPADLLTSVQAETLKNWMVEQAHLAAVITLPEQLFKQAAKSIYVFKKSKSTRATFVYPLENLNDQKDIHALMTAFQAHFDA